MAKSETDVCKYKSRYGGTEEIWVTPAQIIAEVMCERMARKDSKTLPVKFWDTEQWKKTFLLQLRFANALFKLYDPKAISKALKSKEGLKIYSLNAPWLDDLIKKEQLVIEKDNKNIDKYVEPESTGGELPASRPIFTNKKSTLDRLR